jgi:hypothetical protein
VTFDPHEIHFTPLVPKARSIYAAAGEGADRCRWKGWRDAVDIRFVRANLISRRPHAMNTPLKKTLALAERAPRPRAWSSCAPRSRSAMPDTDFAPGTDPMGHSTLTIRVANGVELLASGDMRICRGCCSRSCATSRRAM